jgi:predicted metal-dependent peptidase
MKPNSVKVPLEVLRVEVSEKMVYTYDEEMEKRGIDRNSLAYRQATPWAISWIDQYMTGYGFHIRRYVRRMTHRIQTMAVHVTKTHIELLVNPDFAALLTLKERCGVLIHEVLHIILKHVQRTAAMGAKGFHRDQLHVLAMECAVNTHLQGPGLLPEPNVSPKNFKEPDPDVDEEHWSNFPERLSYEAYYQLFKKLVDASPWHIPFALQGQGLVVEAGLGPDGTDDEIFGNILPVPNIGDRLPAEIMDEHGTWFIDEDMSAEDVEAVVESEVRSAERSAKEAGKGSVELTRIVDELYGVNSIPWSSLFSAMFSRVVSFSKVRTVVKTNRRTGEPGGSMLEPELDVIIYIDVSGSMGNDVVELLLHEAKNASRSEGVSVWVQQFDDGLIGDAVLLNKYKHVQPTRHGYGGTSFQPVIEDIKKKRPGAAFIGTDGWAPPVAKPAGCSVAWIITSNGDEHDWGMTIRLPPPSEAKKMMAKIERHN